MEFKEAIDAFVRYLKFEKRYSPHTAAAYESDLTQFRIYLATAYDGLTMIPEITHHHIRSWLAAMKEADEATAATTLNRKLSSLNSFYAFARRQGLADKNPVRMLHTIRKPERLPVSLKISEASLLINEVDFGPGFKGFTDRLICELLYSTGMRRQELITLRETDVAWGARLLRILGKGNKERMIPVPEALIDALRDYIDAKRTLEAADRDALLVLPNGKPLYAGYVYRTVKEYIGQVTTQQKRSPHVLRHSFATHLLNNGANIQAIKDLLGHSSLIATQVYTHTDVERLKEIHKGSHPRG